LLRKPLIRAPTLGRNEKLYQAGVLVNHEAKLKGVAKPSDYTKNPAI
jgi:hypothetical protein